MKITNNTVLISGGSAGIGFEIAKLLTEGGNHVIITGRDKSRLNAAASQLKNVTAIQFDLTKGEDVENLVNTIQSDFPELNIVINNAAYAVAYDLKTASHTWEMADEEMHTNYISLMRLTEKLLPQLLTRPEAALVNVSSVAAISPNIAIASYSASKAAVHSYTESLRLAFRDTQLKVFELMPPLVATDFSKDIGGPENGIPASQVATEFLDAFEKDEYEIHVGLTAKVYELARTSPTSALHAVNKITEEN